MAAKITVDIEAKVKGYQEAIELMKAAFAKLDPGTTMAKSIKAGILSAEAELKSLSRNMFPTASSEGLIDAIINKVNHLGDSIIATADKMKGLGINDLDLSATDPLIQLLISNLDLLLGKFTETISLGMKETINNSQELGLAFKDLGIELNNNSTTDSILDAVIAKSEEAKQKVTEMEQAFSKAEKKYNTEIGNLTALTNNPLFTNKDLMDKDLQNIASDYTNAINKLKPQLEQGLKSLDIKGGEKKREELLNNFLGGLTPENLRERLMELKNSVLAAAKETLTASEIYKGLFGDTLGRGGNASAIEKALLANIFPSDSVFNDIKTNFLQKLSEISKYLTDAQIGNVLGLLSKGQIDTALEKTLQYLLSAYQTLQGKVVKASLAVYDAIEGKDTARANLETAKTSSSLADALYNKLLNLINDLIQKNSDLLRLIEQLRREIDARKKGALEQVKRSGTGAAERAGELMFPTAQVKMYKTELEQATAAELMIGKVLGVVLRWFSIYAAVRMVGLAVRSVISTIKELDATITEIAIVTNMTQEELWGQMDKYTDTARKYATSISGVYKVSLLYYQLGLLQADVMALTEQTLKMARVSGLDYATATDYMTNAVRSFKMEMQDAQNVVDVYSAIAASSATSVTELASAMSKTASSAQAVGSSFLNTTAMMAVMIEATRESAENIGSAMKSIISRYGEMTSDPSKLVDSEGEEMSINRVDKALLTVGISIHDATGQFRDFDEVIMELAEKWDTIDKNTQRYIATIMAGNRQQSRFLALVSSYDRLKELSLTAADSEDASQLLFLKTLDSVDAKTQQLLTSLLSLYTDTGLEKIYKGLLDYANEFIKTLTNMPKLFDKPIPAILKIGTTFASLATTVSTVFGLIKNVIEANIQAILKRETAAAAGAAEERKAAEDAVTDNFVANSEARKRVFEQELLYYKSLMSGGNGNLGLPRPRANPDAIPAEGTVGPAPTRFGRLFNNKNKKNKTNGGITAKSAGLALGMNIAGLALTGISSGMQLKRDGSLYVKGGLGIAGQTLSMAGMGTMISPGIGTAIGATAGAIMGLIENWNVLTETLEGRLNRLKEAAEEANNNKLKSKAELKTLTEYKQKYDELNKSLYESEEKKKEFIDLLNEIAATYPELIASMDAEGNYVIDMANAYEKLAEAKAKTYKKDFISNISAELEGLGNIDYMLLKYYGTKPLHNAGGIGGSSYFSFSNKGDLETVSKKYLEYFKSSERNITPELNLSWVSNTKSHTYREIFGLDTVAGDSIFTPASISEQLTLFYDKLILSMADYASQGLSRFEAALKTIEKFKDDPVAKQISNFEEYLYKFNTGLYNYFLVLSEGLKDLDDLIQKFYKRNNLEWLSMLSLTTGIEVTDLQFDVMSKLANQLWENFKNNPSAWTHLLGDTFINDEGKTDKWDWNDVYNQFLTEIINPEWFKTLTKLLINLQDKKANEFYKTIGQLTREQVKENPLSNKFPEILELYDEKFAEILGDGTKENLGLYQEAINNMDFVSPDIKNILSKFKDLFGPEFLMGILDNYHTILDNENLTDDQKTKLINALSDIYAQIGTIPDPLKRATAISKILSVDLTSLEGIYSLMENLSNAGIEIDKVIGTSGKTIKQLLIDFSNTLLINLITSFESFCQDIISQSQDFEKALSGASKGMDLKATSEMVNKLNLTLQDFTFKDGKYFYDIAEAPEKIKQAYFKYNEELKQRLDEEYEVFAGNSEMNKLGLLLKTYGGLVDRGILDVIKDDINNINSYDKIDRENYWKNLGLEALLGEKLLGLYNLYYSGWDKKGSFNKYVLTLLTESHNNMAAIIDLYGAYQINAILLQNGYITEFLNNIFKEDSDAKAKAEAAIKSGNIEDLASLGLSDFISIIINGRKDAAANIYKKINESIDKGPSSYISEADTSLWSEDTLFNLTSAGILSIVTDQNNGFLGYQANINKDNIEEYVKLIYADKNLSNEEKLSQAKSAWNKIYNKTSPLDNLEKLASSASLTGEEALSFVDSLGRGTENLSTVMLEYGYLFNEETEKWEQMPDAIEKLLQKLNEAIASGSSIEKINAIQAELDKAKNKQLSDRRVAIKDITSNYKELTEENIEKLATAFKLNYNLVKEAMDSNGDGTYRINITNLKALLNYDELSEADKANIDAMIAAIHDDYLNAIINASSLVSKGTTKQADMENFVKEYNELFETQKNAGDLFNYSEILESWTLNPEVLKEYVAKLAKKLKESGFLKPDDVDKWIKTQTSLALAGNVNISEFLSSDNTDEAGKAYKKLTESMREYYKSLSGTANKTDEEINSVIAKEINNLKSGGIDAVKEVEVWASRSGREATSQEIEEAFNFAINELNDAMGHLTDLTVGQITTGKLREYLLAAGKVDDNGVVTSVDGMVSVYRSIYLDMKHTAGSTTAGLNAAYAKVKTAEEQDDIDAIAAMGDAMGMTYDTLGSLLAKTNTDLEQWLSDNKDLYQNIGAGKIRITNFTAFAKQQGWESGSEEYLSAFNAYNDSLVALNRQTEKNILEEVQNVLSAKGGDLINLTYLSSKLGEVAELVLSGTLQQYGASLTDGILTIREGANLVAITLEIISTATEAADLLPEEIADLKDAISKALQSFTDAINNGISGKLTERGKLDLQTMAKNYLGIDASQLTFTQTVDGLKLSLQSAILLYLELKKIDELLASLVFDDLNKSLLDNNEHYKNVSDIMNRIKYLLDEIAKADGTVSNARRQEYEAELAVAKEILAVRSTSEDSSFNFMSNKIPGGQNNPLNYYSSWLKAIKTIEDGVKVKGKKNKTLYAKGFIDYQDFYNIATEMNNLAKISGLKFKLAGVTLDGSMEAASKLIQQGAASLLAVDTGELKVNLKSVGLDILGGANSLSEGVDAGIHAMAQSQIDMLDGLISLLETITAMEDLGDVAGEDMEIELPDIQIQDKDTGEWSFTSAFDKWRKAKLAEIKEGKTGFAKAANEVKIAGKSLKDIIAQKAGEWTEDLAKILNSLWKAAKNGDWDVDNVAESMKKVLADAGLGDDANLTIDVGKTHYIVQGGAVVQSINFESDGVKKSLDKLTKTGGKFAGDVEQAKKYIIDQVDTFNKGGKSKVPLDYTLIAEATGVLKYDKKTGKSYVMFNGEKFEGKNIATALRGRKLAKELGKSFKDITVDKKEGTASAKVTVKGEQELTFDVTMGKNNKAKWSTEYNGKPYTGDSKLDVLKQIYNDVTKKDKNGKMVITEGKHKGENLTFEQWVYAAFKIRLNDASYKFVNKNGLEVDPAKNKVLNQKIKDFLKQTDDDIRNAVTDNKNGTSTIKIGGYSLTVDTDSITVGNDKKNAGLIRLKLMESLGLDTLLVESITQGIVGALPSISDAIKKLGENKETTSNVKTLASALSSLFTSLTKLNGLNLNTLKTLLSAFLKDLNTSENGEGNILSQFTLEVTAVITKFISGENADPNTLVNALLAIITSYTDEGTGAASKESLLAFLDNLKALIVAYDDSGATNKEGILNAFDELTASINAYSESPAPEGKQAILEAFRKLTGLVVSYADSEAATGQKDNLLSLFKSIAGLIVSYSDTNATGKTEIEEGFNDLTAKVNKYLDNPTAEGKQEIMDSFKNLDAKIAKINPEAFKTWYETNKEVEITAKIKMDSNLSEEEIKSRIKYLESMIEQQSALLTTNSGEADLQSYAKESGRDIGDVKEEARQELAQMKAELEVLKKLFAEALKKTEEPDTTTTTTVEDFVNESEGEAQQGGEDTALAFLLSFMETLELNGGDLDATLEGVGIEKEDLIANINEALSDAKLPPLEPGVNLDDVINKIKSLLLPDKTINIYGYYAGEKNTNEQEGASAKGNVALASGNAMASGTKTLMGELGPELVVSHGRYFVAGQNGAEFVDLDKDAIVFNHLQTESLLKNGKAGRGKAKTNERNAVGMATGNVNGGPALASASSALNALKQLRAMWQSLLDASVQDMASKAGSGGGGGGGGDKKNKGFMKEVERWYTLMQRIAQLEKDINYQELLRNKIMSDRNGTGKQYWLSLKKSLNDLGQEISYQKELAISLLSYFDKRRAELNKLSGFSKLYRFDASGQLVYNDKAKLKNGKKGGLSFLSDLFATDTKTGAAKYTDELKYKKLIDAGLVGSKAYDENGNLIKKPKKGAKKDKWNTYYTEVVKSFSSKMDADKEEMLKLHDSIDDANEKVLELELQRNEILNEMRDKYLELEDLVFNAVKELKLRAIDELQDLRDATEKSNLRYLDGLNAALQSEQNMYLKNESRNELDKMRRQLAILLRSGGSASLIASLQNDIRSKEKDLYFDERLSQIDAILKASDNLIKKMDLQIEIMLKTLDYQVKYGLLWNDVNDIMKKSPKEIADFIKKNSSDYWGKSSEALNKANDELARLIDYVAASNQQRKLLESVKQVDELWKGSATTVWDEKNKKWKIKYNGQGTENALEKLYSKKVWDAASAEAKKLYYATYNRTGDPKAAAKAARKVLDDEKKKLEPAKDPTKEPGKTDDKKGGKGDKGGNKGTYLTTYIKVGKKLESTKKKKVSANYKVPAAPARPGYTAKTTYGGGISGGKVLEGHHGTVTYTYTKITGYKVYAYVDLFDSTGKKIDYVLSWGEGKTLELAKKSLASNANTMKNRVIKDKKVAKVKTRIFKTVPQYKRGGQVDYTGLAQVDGTPSRPEAFFNAEQTKILKNGLLGNSSRILASTLEEFNSIVEGMADGATYNTIDRGSSLVIENASVNMNVQSIANDYDARRAGELALEQMMKIARKSGTKGVSRR